MYGCQGVSIIHHVSDFSCAQDIVGVNIWWPLFFTASRYETDGWPRCSVVSVLSVKRNWAKQKGDRDCFKDFPFFLLLPSAGSLSSQFLRSSHMNNEYVCKPCPAPGSAVDQLANERTGNKAPNNTQGEPLMPRWWNGVHIKTMSKRVENPQDRDRR